MPNLIDILKRNNSDREVGLIEECAQAHPEIMMGDARTIKGLLYKTLIRTGLPTAAFRNANKGSATTKSTYVNRLIETFILDLQWDCDKAVADQSEDGPEAYIADEAEGIVEASLQHMASQFYYGVANDAKGFPGLRAMIDTTNMVVDAEGTTSGGCSEVWAVKFGTKNVRWVLGSEGKIEVTDPTVIQKLDDDGNPYAAYWQYLLGYVGLQVGSVNSVGAVKDLDTTKTLTDDHLSSLLGKFPVGIVPDAFFMSRRSLVQLQQSRTATNATGKEAPFPTEAFGVPIKPSDAVSDIQSPWS